MIRILGGQFRSRQLISPQETEASRPYQSHIKESVFNLLRGWFEGARVLDLFAGVGTVGLEAISRGAAKVVMVEKDRRTFRSLQENIEVLGCGDRAEALNADALGPLALARAPKPVDLLFIDPPYQMMEQPESRQRVFNQIAAAKPLLAAPSFVILRSPVGPIDDVDLEIDGFAGPEVHQYGKGKWVLLYQPEMDEASSPAT